MASLIASFAEQTTGVYSGAGSILCAGDEARRRARHPALMASAEAPGETRRGRRPALAGSARAEAGGRRPRSPSDSPCRAHDRRRGDEQRVGARLGRRHRRRVGRRPRDRDGAARARRRGCAGGDRRCVTALWPSMLRRASTIPMTLPISPTRRTCPGGSRSSWCSLPALLFAAVIAAVIVRPSTRRIAAGAARPASTGHHCGDWNGAARRRGGATGLRQIAGDRSRPDRRRRRGRRRCCRGLVASRRRRPPAPGERERAALAEAVEWSLDDLRREPDPRRAVIAAYARMERMLADHGIGRRAFEAPLEYLARVLALAHAGAAPIQALTRLFQEAKFSPYTIGARQRDQASTRSRRSARTGARMTVRARPAPLAAVPALIGAAIAVGLAGTPPGRAVVLATGAYSCSSWPPASAGCCPGTAPAATAPRRARRVRPLAQLTSVQTSVALVAQLGARVRVPAAARPALRSRRAAAAASRHRPAGAPRRGPHGARRAGVADAHTAHRLGRPDGAGADTCRDRGPDRDARGGVS